MGVVVREALDADLPATVEIVVAHDGGPAEEWLANFREHIHDPDRLFLVAEVDGRVAGFGQARRFPGPRKDSEPPPGWYLSGVTVAPQHRRRRLGTALTTARLEALRERTDVVHYLAEPGNHATVALHARLGFAWVREVRLPGDSRVLELYRLDYRQLTDGRRGSRLTPPGRATS